MKKKIYKIVYLLHEISHREFESKVFLGLEFLKNNWKVYILQRNFFFLNLDKLPSGLVFYKSSVPADLKIFKNIKKAGHKLICLDEESIAEFESAYDIKLKYGTQALKYLDLLIVTHHRTIKILKKKYKFIKNKLLRCLHPRFDFINFLNDNDDPISIKIKKKFKKFIFLPTTFYCNHVMGKSGFKRMYEEAFNKITNKQNSFLEKLYNRDKLFINKYKELFAILSKKLKNFNFVLRPHPTENVTYWRKFSKKFNNFEIDNEYPSFYYQKVAKAIIQFNSTIAFESIFFKKKSLQFQPINNVSLNKNFDIYAINKVIKKIKSETGIIKEILNLVHKKKRIKKKFQNIYSQKIFNHIRIFNIKSSYDKQIYFPKKFSYKIIYKYILFLLSNLYILDLLPQKFLIGKFKILRREYIPIHKKFFSYRSIKYYKITTERFNFINEVGKKYLKNQNFKINIIFQNNFELTVNK